MLGLAGIGDKLFYIGFIDLRSHKYISFLGPNYSD